MIRPTLPPIEIMNSAVDRVLSLRCVDIMSPNYGSFDRDFWSYRTIRGFQSAPYQHVMSGFAYLQQQLLDDDYRYGEIAEAALSRWIENCNRNGSANEWYRHEQSFCATAMGLHAATETVLTLMENHGVRLSEHQLAALARSERWLRDRSNPLAANQNIASATGRWMLGVLLADQPMQDSAATSLSKVEQEFSRLGYLAEYGGFDIGYSLISLDLLVAPHRAGCPDALSIATRICGLLDCVVSKGGQFPFALGSRGTHHPFYAGVHYFSSLSSEASQLLCKLASNHISEQLRQVSSYDDRYLATFGFSALARTLSLRNTQSSSPTLMKSTRTLKSPLERIEVPGGTLFCNRHLGSGIQFLADNHTSFVHLGYSVVVDDHRWCSLSAPADEATECRHQFVMQSTRLPLQRFGVVFALLQAFCRIPPVASRVSLLARMKLGRPSKVLKLYFVRTLEISGSVIHVKDEICSDSEPETLVGAPLRAFPFHSPSQFFANQSDWDGSAIRTSQPFDFKKKAVIRWQLDTTAVPLTAKLSNS